MYEIKAAMTPNGSVCSCRNYQALQIVLKMHNLFVKGVILRYTTFMEGLQMYKVELNHLILQPSPRYYILCRIY